LAVTVAGEATVTVVDVSVTVMLAIGEVVVPPPLEGGLPPPSTGAPDEPPPPPQAATAVAKSKVVSRRTIAASIQEIIVVLSISANRRAIADDLGGQKHQEFCFVLGA